MAIAPSILLHSSPRSRLQLAFQSVVPGLVETALLFAEQLGEVVGRGGCGGIIRVTDGVDRRYEPRWL